MSPPAACKLGGNGVYRVVAAADTDCSSIYVLLGIPPTRRRRRRTVAPRIAVRQTKPPPLSPAAGTARAFPPPPPLFRFCVWPTRRIETGGRCDSILDGTVALLAFAGMVVSSWLTLSTSNSASIFKLRKRSFGRLLKTAERAALSALSANQSYIPTSVSQLNPSLSVLNLSMKLSSHACSSNMFELVQKYLYLISYHHTSLTTIILNFGFHAAPRHSPKQTSKQYSGSLVLCKVIHFGCMGTCGQKTGRLDDTTI